jgi:hypothetical protein
MHFQRLQEDQAISDCGHYSITKEEPIAGCFFKTARYHPDKDYQVGVSLGNFYKYGMARLACEEHKLKNTKNLKKISSFEPGETK